MLESVCVDIKDKNEVKLRNVYSTPTNNLQRVEGQSSPETMINNSENVNVTNLQVASINLLTSRKLKKCSNIISGTFRGQRNECPRGCILGQ